MCRTRFDQRSITKLVVDLDNGRASSSPTRVSGSPSAEAEAKRLQEAFLTVARTGVSEQEIRQLLDEARTFISAHPREQVTWFFLSNHKATQTSVVQGPESFA